MNNMNDIGNMNDAKIENMQQKTKIVILALLVVGIVVAIVYLIPYKMSEDAANSQQGAQASETAASTPNTDLEISGKIRSLNEKSLYIELADGTGFVVNIDSGTPVSIQGIDGPGTLADLKAGQNVTADVGAQNKASRILIKK